MYVSVHDATFYPSTGINNATNLLCLMRNSIGTNESPYPFYLVILDKDGCFVYKIISIADIELFIVLI